MQAPSSFLMRYGVAAGCAALAVLVRLALDAFLGDTIPLALAFAAVIIATWYGGAGPGLCAAVLGLLTSYWLLLEPRGELGVKQWPGPSGVGGYVIATAILLAF